VRVAKQAHCPFVVSSRTHGDFLGVSQTLLVFAKQQETGGELKVASQVTEDGQLLISVSDTGCGLVVVVKDAQGRIKLNQLMNLTAAGAATGALWGTLIGFIFLMPLLGTALGAASGALGGKLSDFGIDDKFMKEAAGALQPGTAGLFLLIRKMTADKVLADLKGSGGTLIRTSFDEAKESAIREALADHAAAEAKA
jgi:uncharacterized membrane protein